MNQWRKYLNIQAKRIGKALPGICLLTVALTVGLLILLWAMLFFEENRAEKQPVRIGIVGDTEDSYLGVGIRVLKNIPSIRRLADIRELSEIEAAEQFANGKISAYLLIPEGFVDSLVTGENKALTYVTQASGGDIGSLLMEELIGAISELVTTTQASVQALRIYMVRQGKAEEVREAMEELNLALLETLYDRQDLFALQELGISNRISLSGHLFTGLLVLLLLLWGCCGASVMVRREDSLCMLLKRKGMSGKKQVAAEGLAYCALLFVSLCCMFLCMLSVKSAMGLSIREWDALFLTEKVGFFIRLLPIVLMLGSLQALLYELVRNVVTGGLLQFVAAVTLSYTGGCIYPLSFFPDVIQKLSYWSPVGTALRFLQYGLTGQKSAWELFALLAYTGLFVGLWMIKREMRGSYET